MKIKQIQKGFTLIETLVSLALFSVVLVIVGGVIVSIIDVNKKNQIISAVVNNLNYSVDSMVRDIKTGYLYKCDYDEVFGEVYTIDALKADPTPREGKCNTSLTIVSTISGEDVVVKYQLIKPADGKNNYIEKTVYDTTTNSPSLYSITDKNSVKIDDLVFVVSNPEALDSEMGSGFGQPSVFLSIKGVAGNENVDASKFYIQTFISQRLINITDFKDEII